MQRHKAGAAPSNPGLSYVAGRRLEPQSPQVRGGEAAPSEHLRRLDYRAALNAMLPAFVCEIDESAGLRDA